MAATIPAKLKTADVQRFATRAAQLEKFRPIVSYWCEYFILQIILNKQLHVTDDETQTYAIQLMDKLETYKSSNPSNDAVIDDVAAKAYIENFGLDTFAKADESQRSNKVTRQTADTFQAAATFLDLLSIWGPLEGEAAAKSKFAKFHALRIARALKAGEDPNETNPKIEEPVKPDDHGIDAELRDMEDAGQPGYKPPTVETVPDSVQSSRPGSSLQGDRWATPMNAADRSAATPADQADDAASRNGSVGGGYFPSVPEGTRDNQAPSPMDVSETAPDEPQIPSVPNNQPGSDPSNFYTSAPPPPSAPMPYDESEMPSPGYASIPQPPPPSAFVPQASRAPPPVPIPAPAPSGRFNTDDEAVAAAQKHAKWAISALNFEDVPTAIKELRFALQKLGAA